MFARYASSAGAGAVITASLVFVMQFLIRNGTEVITPPTTRYTVDWVKLIRDTPPETRDPVIEKPAAPPELPPALPPESGEQNPVGVRFGPTPPAPGNLTGVPQAVFGGDGPLINIFKVQPNYPPAAAARGLEGVVVVEYDVNTDGLVENVRILESSSPLFDKAAREAAYRFRYKPRVVDGIAYGATNLRQLFRFEMAN